MLKIWKWLTGGRGLGVKGGAGKLCKFDKDGNVVSSGLDPEAVSSKLYAHRITLANDSDSTQTSISFIIYNRSSAQLNTFAKLRDAMGTGWYPCSGSIYYDPAAARFPAVIVYRNGSGSNATIMTETYLGTGMSLPPYYNFESVTTYQPTDVVKEV